MTKFFNIFKTLFLAHFYPIFSIFVAKFFFWKIQLCQKWGSKEGSGSVKNNTKTGII